MLVASGTAPDVQRADDDRASASAIAMLLRSETGAEENEALRQAMRKFKGQKGSSEPTPKELARLGQFKSTYFFHAEYSSMPNIREMRTRRFTR